MVRPWLLRETMAAVSSVHFDRIGSIRCSSLDSIVIFGHVLLENP